MTRRRYELTETEWEIIAPLGWVYSAGYLPVCRRRPPCAGLDKSPIVIWLNYQLRLQKSRRCPPVQGICSTSLRQKSLTGHGPSVTIPE